MIRILLTLRPPPCSFITLPSLSIAVDHSIVMYLMSPTGEFLDFYTQLMTAGEIADRIEQRMKGKR